MIREGSRVQILKLRLGVDSELEGEVGEVLGVNNGIVRVRISNAIVDCKPEELKELDSHSS